MNDWISSALPCGTNVTVAVPENGWYHLYVGNMDAAATAMPGSHASKEIRPRGSVLLHTTDAAATITKVFAVETTGDGNVGSLVYLNKGVTVRVEASSTTTTTNSNEIMWLLRFFRFHNGGSAGQPAPALGCTVAPFVKKFRCRLCPRTYARYRDFQQHWYNDHQRATLKKRKRSSAKDDIATTNDSMYRTELQVIFQDDYLAIVNKPQNMPVMGTKPSLQSSDLLLPLVTTLQPSLLLENDDKPLAKPRPVHRLDSATGGILVVAKTKLSESRLKTAFAERHCHKRYRALVQGKLELGDANHTKHGVVQQEVKGKPAKTLYRPVRYIHTNSNNNTFTVVDLWPVTGRFHQLRRHMKLLGHSIVGDKRYQGVPKGSDPVVYQRLCLWAMEITLPHPKTGLEITCQLPDDPEWLETVIRHLETKGKI